MFLRVVINFSLISSGSRISALSPKVSIQDIRLSSFVYSLSKSRFPSFVSLKHSGPNSSTSLHFTSGAKRALTLIPHGNILSVDKSGTGTLLATNSVFVSFTLSIRLSLKSLKSFLARHRPQTYQLDHLNTT